jgi:hypothetical protein
MSTTNTTTATTQKVPLVVAFSNKEDKNRMA